MSRVAPAKEAFFQKINFRSLETRAPEYQELHKFDREETTSRGRGFGAVEAASFGTEKKKTTQKSEASDEKMETPGAGDDGTEKSKRWRVFFCHPDRATSRRTFSPHHSCRLGVARV